MDGLALLVFVVCFATMMAAIGFGAHVLEVQRKKNVTAVLAAVSQVPAARGGVLVERRNAAGFTLSGAFASLNLARKAEAYIQQSGLGWSVPRLIANMLLAAAVGAVVGLRVRILLFAGLSAVGMAALFASFPLLYMLRKRSKRLAEFERQFPEALDFLARAMSAGHAFNISLDMLATEAAEPVQSEFKRVYNEQNLGAPLGEVLKHLAERVPLIDVRFFVSAVLMQRESGGNLGEILTKLATVIRERFRLKGQVKSASAHGRITAGVLTVLPVAVLLGLLAINPNHFGPFLRHPAGKFLSCAAVLLQLAGYFIMRKIVNIKV
jgi:tight adherence protein B